MSSERNTTAGLTDAGVAALVPVTVEAVDGPGAGPLATLKSGTLRVGAGQACELKLTDPAVSREHASLELLPGAVRVRDLKSKNGTHYLQARIEEALVPLGGSVRVGKTTLRFLAQSEAMPASARTELHGLTGVSLAMRRMFALLERLGPTPTSVLIQGETGSGKHRAAQALHALSGRAGPLVVVDCGALPPGLAEAELFGHERGAFTGAVKARPGLFEQAQGGTLFLDEVAELPLELQPKLLRVLESRTVRRLGADAELAIDARVIAASRVPLEGLVEQGRMRADLYFRLAVTTVEVPPLRQRLDDIVPLALEFAREVRGAEVKLSDATIAALQCEPWPGNVRQLRNAVTRALVLGESEPSEEPPAAPRSYHEAREALLTRFERDYLASLLARHEGNVSAAAREAGLSRMHLYRLVERHGLSEAAR